MERKCEACGRKINEKLVKCPFCGKESIGDKEPSLSSEQIRLITKQVKREFYKTLIFWLGIVSLIFGIGFWQVYRFSTEHMQKFLVQRISEEFQQPTIHETVQEVAASNAQQILEKEIQPEVDKFRAETESAMQEAKGLANAALLQLKDLTSLIELEDAARYGSRAAFTNLLQMASQENQTGIMAKRRIAAIIQDLSIYRFIPGLREKLAITKNGESVNIDELSTSELFDLLESPTIPKEYIRSLMADIAQRPNQEICKEAKEIFETSDSLIACAATCGILSKTLGNKAEFLAFEKWSKICDDEL